MNRKSIVAAALSFGMILSAAVPACAAETEAAELKPITFCLDWTPIPTTPASTPRRRLATMKRQVLMSPSCSRRKTARS